MVVRITTQSTLAVGQPQVLFDGPHYAAVNNAYDVSADGQRVLIIKESDQAVSASQINVVLNWTEELKRLVPTD
jgi:hypothetical protein